jgi:hypothetical protein
LTLKDEQQYVMSVFPYRKDHQPFLFWGGGGGWELGGTYNLLWVVYKSTEKKGGFDLK